MNIAYRLLSHGNAMQSFAALSPFDDDDNTVKHMLHRDVVLKHVPLCRIDILVECNIRSLEQGGHNYSVPKESWL